MRMQMRTLLVLAVASVVATACSKSNDMATQKTMAPPAAAPAPEATPGETAPAAPTAAGSAAETLVESNDFAPWPGAPAGLGGVASALTLKSDSADWLLAVRLDGLPAGEHAWHIHGGPCSDSSAAVVLPISPVPGMQAIDGNLASTGQGATVDTVKIPDSRLDRARLNQGKLSLHVHARGGANHGPTIACAAM